MTEKFFPERPTIQPKIYAYSDSHPEYAGMLKIGYTGKSVKERMAEHYPTITPVQVWKVEVEESAMRNDGTVFKDHGVHAYLGKKGFKRPKGEWFQCTAEDVRAAILAVKRNEINEENRTLDFRMRPEQKAAVDMTANYFSKVQKENTKKIPHFLWNAKMRFGKTFATYQLAKKMSWKKILILTFKPAVESAWENDLKSHIDFEGWQFVSSKNAMASQVDKKRPVVCFGSFQDYLGKNPAGGIKSKNEWVHATHWDCVVLDEYHFGAWRENAKELFEAEPNEQDKTPEFTEEDLPITTDAYLYLTGTPFRALSIGEFIEDQIYHWTYADEQRVKASWEEKDNPYLPLPRMVMLTYKMPESVCSVARQGEYNEFDLNEFFRAEGEGKSARFKHESEVQKWLDIIRGEMTLDTLKLGKDKPPMPYSDTRLLNVLSHTLWFLPKVNSCFAMANLLKQKQNDFYKKYKVIVAAGNKAGMGAAALKPVEEAMDNPLQSHTITLSCGKLMTGVSVRPWTGIFMLKNMGSPETYFQAAFRVQTPWTIKNPDGKSPKEEEIIKQECYVFDFAPTRALKQIADYCANLGDRNKSVEANVNEFIQFLPVLAFDGSSMIQIDAAGILQWAMTGTTATLLANRWQSHLLVNVDNFTLERLFQHETAMNALMGIEGFRKLGEDIETIINKSETISKLKQKANDKNLTTEEKKELSQEEKERKNKRKEIQEKLLKFATRIPIFMYLTDYREETLKDVIKDLEPELFKKVTNLTKKNFQLLVDLNVFNSSRMNDAVLGFKQYEDSSLSYSPYARKVETS